MNEIIEKVKHLIERDQLNVKTRKREVVYKRAYLMYILRKQELSFNKVGSFFNKDHATAMYQCKMVNRYLHEMNDEIYINYVRDYLLEFEGEKYTKPVYNLTMDILNCNSTYQLLQIKKRIREKKYGDDATYLE
jgi:hypothetical protein